MTLPIGPSSTVTVTVDGQAVLLVRYPSRSPLAAEPDPMTAAARAASRALVDHPGVDVVGLVPVDADDATVAHVVSLALVRLASHTAVVTVRPVTDAVKRVVGDERAVIAGTVDRASLRWAGGPAFIRREVLQQALAGSMPPADLLARVAELAGSLAVL